MIILITSILIMITGFNLINVVIPEFVANKNCPMTIPNYWFYTWEINLNLNQYSVFEYILWEVQNCQCTFYYTKLIFNNPLVKGNYFLSIIRQTPPLEKDRAHFSTISPYYNMGTHTSLRNWRTWNMYRE